MSARQVPFRTCDDSYANNRAIEHAKTHNTCTVVVRVDLPIDPDENVRARLADGTDWVMAENPEEAAK
jgi:hypothetical protein